jgi:hypothetical protein
MYYQVPAKLFNIFIANLNHFLKYKFDAAFGGARRDEEKSRAKERVYSFRDKNHGWDPKNQRPELWNIYNGRIDRRAPPKAASNLYLFSACFKPSVFITSVCFLLPWVNGPMP